MYGDLFWLIEDVIWQHMILLSAESLYCIDYFRNKSGKAHPIWTKVGTHTQVKGRQFSRNFGRDRLSGGEMGG